MKSLNWSKQERKKKERKKTENSFRNEERRLTVRELKPNRKVCDTVNIHLPMSIWNLSNVNSEHVTIVASHL